MVRETPGTPEDALEERAEFILGALGLTWRDLRGKKILDLGAGSAELAQAAKKHHIDIVSLDNDASDISDEVRKKIPYIIADAQKTGLPEESFDLVLCHAGPLVIHDADDPERLPIMRESLRIAKTGGELRFGTFFNAIDKSASVADDTLAVISRDFPNVRMGPSSEKSKSLPEYRKYFFSLPKR